MRYLVMTIICLVAAPGIAHSKEMAARGIGTKTCGEFAHNYAAVPGIELTYFTWAQGLLTGLNFASMAVGGKYRDMDGDTDEQEAHIRAYCNDHPLAYYYQAVLDLAATLPYKQAPASK